MENGYGLTLDEYNIVNNIYDITKKIYYELNILKENNKHNIPNEYQKIKELLNIETNIYKKIDKYNIESINLFISDLKDYSYAQNYNYAKGNVAEIIKARIVNKLNYLIDTMDMEYEYEELTDTELEELDSLYENEEDTFNYADDINAEDIKNTFDDIDNINEVINLDILKIVFRILEDEIKRTNNEKLIDYKYNLAFIYDTVLNKLINSAFKIDENIYLNMGMNKSLYNVTDNLLKTIFDEVTWAIIENELDDLLAGKNTDIIFIIMRSVLIFSSEKIITSLKILLEHNNINYDFLNYLNKDKDIPKLVIIKK